MVTCRACYRESEELVLLDETTVLIFNILTSLDVRINDGLPQHLCQDCFCTLNEYVQFRDKCISVDTQLRKEFGLLCEVETKSAIYGEINVCSSDLYNDGVIDDDFTEEDNVPIEEIKKEVQGQEYKTGAKTKQKKKNVKKIHAIKILKTECNKNGIKAVSMKIAKIKFNCGLCSESFEDASIHKEHLDIHIKDKTCSICSKCFKDEYQTLAHRLMHLPGRERSCHICLKKFKKEIYLEFHYKKYHSYETDIFLECSKCNHKSDSPINLRKHHWKCHIDTTVICDVCKQIFQNKYQLILHMEKHLNRRQYVCDKCDFTSNYRNGLQMHYVHKHSKEKVPCKKCGKMFKDQPSLDNHKCSPRSTAGVCPECGKLLSGTDRLRRHMQIHSNVMKYKCEKCPAAYKSRSSLRVHLDQHDGIRRKKCEYCPMAFYSGTVLIKHRRTHTGIKPYVCEICQKAFTGGHNLKVHMKTHGIANIVTKKKLE